MNKYLLLLLSMLLSKANADMCPGLSLSENEVIELRVMAREYVDNKFDIAHIESCKVSGEAYIYFEPYDLQQSTFKLDYITCSKDDSIQWICKNRETRRYVHLGMISRSLRLTDETDIEKALAIARVVYSEEPCLIYDKIIWIPKLKYDASKEIYDVEGFRCGVNVKNENGKMSLVGLYVIQY